MATEMGMWREHLTGTASDITHTLTSAAVPSGERRYLAIVGCRTNTTADADCCCYVVSHGQRIPFFCALNMAANHLRSRRQAIWLTEGEHLEFAFSGIVNGEVVEVGITGHIQHKARK